MGLCLLAAASMNMPHQEMGPIVATVRGKVARVPKIARRLGMIMAVPRHVPADRLAWIACLLSPRETCAKTISHREGFEEERSEPGFLALPSSQHPVGRVHDGAGGALAEGGRAEAPSLEVVGPGREQHMALTRAGARSHTLAEAGAAPQAALLRRRRSWRRVGARGGVRHRRGAGSGRNSPSKVDARGAGVWGGSTIGCQARPRPQHMILEDVVMMTSATNKESA